MPAEVAVLTLLAEQLNESNQVRCEESMSACDFVDFYTGWSHRYKTQLARYESEFRSSISDLHRNITDESKFILDSSAGEQVLTETSLSAAATLMSKILAQPINPTVAGRTMHEAAGIAGAARIPHTLALPSASRATACTTHGIASLHLKFLEQAAFELHSQEDAVLAALSKAGSNADFQPTRSARDVSKRLWLLRAAGWIPSSSDWFPVLPFGVPAAVAQVAQVLAMDESEFWAFRSTCEFYIRKHAPGGGFTPWVPARGPSYLVSNSKAKGGGVTVHGDSAYMQAAGIDGEEDTDSEQEEAISAQTSKRKRRRAQGPTIGTRPSSSQKAQKAAARSAVQGLLGELTPQQAFEEGLLRVDAPSVPLPQPWSQLASTQELESLPPGFTSVPNTPVFIQDLAHASLSRGAVDSAVIERIHSCAQDKVDAQVMKRIAALFQTLREMVPPPSPQRAEPTTSQSETAKEENKADEHSTSAAPVSHSATAPSSSFAFSVQLPGSSAGAASASSSKQQSDGSDQDASDSDGDDDALERYCLGTADPTAEGGSDEDEAADIRQGAYVIIARALQMQMQALTTPEEAQAVTQAAATRCPSSRRSAVQAACTAAAEAVQAEHGVLQLLLSRVMQQVPEVVDFLADGDGGSDESSGSDGESRVEQGGL